MANFTKVGTHYESAEISVSGDFNVHCEFNDRAIFDLQTKTAGSEYQTKYEATGRVIDEDFGILVGKTIKLISDQPGTYTITQA